MKITGLRARDIRFPTSREMDGSDALNLGDYSATYVTLETDGTLVGHGLTFTNVRGFYRRLTQDPQLRWIGPEKGIVHMATGAVVNAVWDLWARREGKPVWKLLAALTPHEALAILEKNAPTKAAREAEMRERGFPAYTTSTGWLGYSDDKVRRLCREALAAGWTFFKMKVGQDLEGNLRRAALMRAEIGREHTLAMDANQCWDVPEAIRQMKELAPFDPYWIEEPTSPDDVLGHAAIAKAVAP